MLQFQFFGVKIEDICITNRLRPDMFIPNFIEHYISSKYLPYLEFRIADHCNMNCKACAEFSGLVKKPHFPNLQQFTRDFERLRELIDDIGQIRILGGEPLLNPEINEYIKVSRRLYPQADIHVVTNALLLTKMPESFFDTLREYNAVVGISFYPPLKNSMPEIMNFLAAKNVPHILYHKEPLNKFFVNTILKPHNRERDMFLTCSAATCLNLWEGQLSVCYKPSAIKIFNEYFNQHLPEDSGLIDIWDKNLTVEKIHAQLSTSFELCRYCTPYMWRKWGRISYPAPISDWIND